MKQYDKKAHIVISTLLLFLYVGIAMGEFDRSEYSRGIMSVVFVLIFGVYNAFTMSIDPVHRIFFRAAYFGWFITVAIAFDRAYKILGLEVMSTTNDFLSNVSVMMMLMSLFITILFNVQYETMKEQEC